MTTSGYSVIEAPVPKQRLVHVHTGPEELGRVYQADLMIHASMGAFAKKLAALPRVTAQTIGTHVPAARAEYEAWQARKVIPGHVQMWEVIQTLDRLLPHDSIVTNGAGNYATWVHRFHRYRGFRTQLAPTSGAMGYGVPAAVAAKIAAPGRTVVAFAGDGCFLMAGQELATAIQYDAPIIVIVVNNGMYGTIRMHQEREHPGRVSGTQLQNPDFAALARAHGAFGARVETTEAFAPAFEEALAAGRPALLHLILDPEAITPRTTISALRAAHAGRRG